jgi:hypothetical protein
VVECAVMQPAHQTPAPPSHPSNPQPPTPQATGRGVEGALRSLVPSALGGRQQVVILADKPKAEMDVAVHETLRWVILSVYEMLTGGDSSTWLEEDALHL